ncbi:MAG: hypothetical protein ACXWLQ_07595, partial [Rhizomicrobium sp.]
KNEPLPNPLNRLPARFGSLQVSRDDILQNLLLEREVGHQPLQTSILRLQDLHPTRLIMIESAIFLAQAIATVILPESLVRQRR